VDLKRYTHLIVIAVAGASGGSVTVSSGVSTVTGSHTLDFTFQGKK
jgi:hypothetical protein